MRAVRLGFAGLVLGLTFGWAAPAQAQLFGPRASSVSLNVSNVRAGGFGGVRARNFSFNRQVVRGGGFGGVRANNLSIQRQNFRGGGFNNNFRGNNFRGNNFNSFRGGY